MFSAHVGKMPLFQTARLDEQVQQVIQEWNQIGQWADADQLLLTGVRGHMEQVQALLDCADSCDQQVRNALRELLVIGHVQRFLLEQCSNGEYRL
jgi:pyridoxal/pyridoxine/pyridoxamine kinase